MERSIAHNDSRFIIAKLRCFVFVVTFPLALSCDEWISVPPPTTDIVREHVFEDDRTVVSSLMAVYGQLSTGSSSFPNSLSIYQGKYADELVSYLPSDPLYLNNIVATNQVVSTIWSDCYSVIYSANLIIEGLAASEGISEAVKSQLTGEALFLRAFCHFYLVNLFGDVPVVCTSDYRINARASRIQRPEVYKQIIKDLLLAKGLLVDSYPSEARVRPNRAAATALLARVYLYAKDYERAGAEAAEIIENTNQYGLVQDLNAVFLKNSKEAIWQLMQMGGTQLYTYEASAFILVSVPPTNVVLRGSLVDSFEAGDLRLVNWINKITSSSGLTTWYYAFKYKENHLNRTGSEYSMVLRVAEQYLIRAEALVHLDFLSEAKEELNVVRKRAGLENTTANSKQELLAAIERERRAELFTEWGHRFFDLKRTGRIDEVLSSIKPNWDVNDALFPIPQSEILVNPNLKPQNPGY